MYYLTLSRTLRGRYSSPCPTTPMHKYDIIGYLSKARRVLVKFSIQISVSNDPVPFLFECPAFCFLFITVFLNSIGVVYCLSHKRCFINVHQMDDEWMNEYHINAWRTWDPHWKNKRAQWSGWADSHCSWGRGSVHTGGKEGHTCPSHFPCGQSTWEDSEMGTFISTSSPMLPIWAHHKFSCQKTKCVCKRLTCVFLKLKVWTSQALTWQN